MLSYDRLRWKCPGHVPGHGQCPLISKDMGLSRDNVAWDWLMIESCVWRTCPHNIWVMSGWDYRNFQCRSTVTYNKVVMNMNIQYIVLQFIHFISFIDNVWVFLIIIMKNVMALTIVSRNVLWTQDTRIFTCPIWLKAKTLMSSQHFLRTFTDMSSRTRHLRVLFEKNRTCPKRTFPSKMIGYGYGVTGHGQALLQERVKLLMAIKWDDWPSQQQPPVYATDEDTASKQFQWSFGDNHSVKLTS
jgi:hypothetical protein